MGTEEKSQKKSTLKMKDPEEIILPYGSINNFIKFKGTLSKAAHKNYGKIGKLVKKNLM